MTSTSNPLPAPSALELVKTHCGLALLLGAELPLGKPPTLRGPLTCFALESPNDRHIEYLCRRAANPAAFRALAPSVVRAHFRAYATLRPTVVICVSAADSLRAYLDVGVWFRAVEDVLQALVVDEPELLLGEARAEATTFLAHLGFKTHVCVVGTPEPSLALALRRLCKERNVDSLSVVSGEELTGARLSRVQDLITGGGAETAAERNVLSPLDQLVVCPATDDAIDALLPKEVPPETTLTSRATLEEADDPAEICVDDKARTEIGIDACLRRIWVKHGAASAGGDGVEQAASDFVSYKTNGAKNDFAHLNGLAAFARDERGD